MNRNSVFLKRRFNCSQDILFEWLTDPKRIAEWFGPVSSKVISAESEPKLGGIYKILLELPDQKQFSIEGKYTELEFPEFIKLDYSYNGLFPAPPPSEVIMKLENINDRETLLHFQQIFESEPADFVNRTKAWEKMFDNLGFNIDKEI